MASDIFRTLIKVSFSSSKFVFNKILNIFRASLLIEYNYTGLCLILTFLNRSIAKSNIACSVNSNIL